MDFQHVFDLSFVSLQSSKEINPRIVFSMGEQHIEVFQTRLRFLTIRIVKESVEEYLGVDPEFTPLDKDIFGNYTFGYGRCGHMIIEDNEVHFGFELCSNVNVNNISMTIYLLLRVFNSMIFDEELRLSNRCQFIQIDTVCCKNLHGHSMGGWISPDLGMWLKKQGESISESETYKLGMMSPRISLPAVEEAMYQVWCKISHSELKENKREYRATVAEDGRFSLVCPGNACDVSIYPDQLYGDAMGTESVRFASHNLDAAVQQITLLAGIAKLCELARNDE